MRTLVSGSVQQDAVSTEAVVGRIVVYREDHDEEERLCLFGNSTSVDIFYDFSRLQAA